MIDLQELCPKQLKSFRSYFQIPLQEAVVKTNKNYTPLKLSAPFQSSQGAKTIKGSCLEDAITY